MSRSYTPLVIIGAPRSGTNMLRDILCRLPGFETWPCDEINYIWRHGNRSAPTDEFSPDQAVPRVAAYVRRRFDQLAESSRASFVVEKTCANSLRVGFVARVLPDARFVFLVRDGRDCVASARHRWRAPLDLRYTLRKARFVPLADAPYYAARYVMHRAKRSFNPERSVPTWGPRYEGMADDVSRMDLLGVCARQWARCVEAADRELAMIEPSRVLRLHYETLVADPNRTVADVLTSLGQCVASDLVRSATAGVSSSSVGKWVGELNEPEYQGIAPELEPALRRLGYAIDAGTGQRACGV